MPGYVYIMRRNRTDRHGRWTLQRQYKIGISTEPQRRLRTVNSAVPGGVVMLAQNWFLDPHRIEKRLHAIFADSRHNLKRVGKGAGKTEWFYLSPIEYGLLRLWLFWLQYRIVIVIGSAVALKMYLG